MRLKNFVRYFLSVLPVILLFAGFSFGATDTMGGLCNVLGKIENFAPVAVKVVAFIVLIVGFVAGGFMIIDRERNMMGRGLIVIGLVIAVFSFLWVVASPLKDVISTGKTALGC